MIAIMIGADHQMLMFNEIIRIYSHTNHTDYSKSKKSYRLYSIFEVIEDFFRRKKLLIGSGGFYVDFFPDFWPGILQYNFQLLKFQTKKNK